MVLHQSAFLKYLHVIMSGNGSVPGAVRSLPGALTHMKTGYKTRRLQRLALLYTGASADIISTHRLTA